MDYEVLEKLGLAPNEIKVYTSLLELGPSNAASLVKKTGLHRPNVYYSLNRLEEKGLISSYTSKRKHFFKPASPKRLLSIVDDKEKGLAETKNELRKAMPQFLELEKQSAKEGQKVEIFRGTQGFRTVIDHVLENAPKNDYYIIGYTGIARKTMGDYYPNWEARRIQRKLVRNALANEENRNYLEKSPHSKVRYLPKEYSSPASTSIYGDKVVIHVMENGKPLAIMITSRGLARVYKRYFKLLWSISSA